jgi:DegV family protein with EDD domain
MSANLKTQVKVVTDSTADISPELAARYNIKIVPLTLMMGTESYRDGYDITPAEFYKKLPQLKALPTTSQPAVPVFEEAYQELLADGSQVISLHISSKLSGTFNSASLAAKSFPNGRVRVIDSKVVSGGLGLLALTAAEMSRAGLDIDIIEKDISSMSDRTVVIATADTLEYLHKGGRIGGLSSLFGTILAIKPIFQIKNGELSPLQNVRTKRKALERIAELVKGMGSLEKLAVMHADSLDEAGDLANLLAPLFPLKDIYVSYMGPVVGAHAGPKTIGICAIKAK